MARRSLSYTAAFSRLGEDKSQARAPGFSRTRRPAPLLTCARPLTGWRGGARCGTIAAMREADLRLRNVTYAEFVRLGRAPAAAEVAAAADVGADAVTAAWRRLDEAHALVLNRAGTEIRMANPFAAVPTAYRVYARGRWWYANCAWDAFGVLAALRADGRIEASCPDCGDSIGVGVTDRCPDDEMLLFHCLVPAAHWWDDIVFT